MKKVVEIEKSLKPISKQRSLSISSSISKLSLFVLITYVIVVVLFQIKTLNPSSSSSSSSSSSWSFIHQLREKVQNTKLNFENSPELKAMLSQLRDSVTFLPLKDLRFTKTAVEGHTWFMSSLNDTPEKDEAEYLYFPSKDSKGRLLCILGQDRHDGAKNAYALAWPHSLPRNATLRHGLTYVSETYYDYNNLWHGLSAMLPFVAWYRRTECVGPARWILYHWGEVRVGMGPWLRTLMEATFGGVHIEGFEGSDGGPNCFEEAVVFRHNSGGMNREKRMEAFDMLRCKGRAFCNVSRGAHVNERGGHVIGLTLLLRSGPRAFKNESIVVGIFRRACQKVNGCKLTVARAENLTFCEQVKLMTDTDILASPHGAQLTNMFFMDRNSSVMEFFPRGWLELAGVGQYVYHWGASWSGMRHQGAWRDSKGGECPLSKKENCMSFYKDSKVGHNETFFADWALSVLNQVKKRKVDEASMGPIEPSKCPCG
ncbi:uncharacterized protein LOC143890694 [Tasmannia lanceolata]|uniref:uncharacterized protein LOC143890694 n=1 Tax=Tasmannia lanceolata TaxID=3420 RepID=UPI004064598D